MSVDLALHPWNEPLLVMRNCFLLYIAGFNLLLCWIFFSFSLCKRKIDMSKKTVFVWFWKCKGDSGFIKWIGKCFLLFCFLEKIVSNLCYFFFKSLITFLWWKCLGLGFSLLEVFFFFTTYSVYFDIGLFKLIISS